MAQCLQSEWYDLHELHYTTANEAITTGNDKLVITVLEESDVSCTGPLQPTAPAPNSAHGISGSGYQLLMAAMVALAFLAV
ncbi:hypothetical protein CK203_085700 [Vitis vinifera]|uniref:Uncharacterized protein n=1 Tax=Vitis vinifera TaxID=29760 RepID=A0A438BLM7_VITVI|nr:hypothetical protein CK203_085700 [Vitis vinifera]